MNFWFWLFLIIPPLLIFSAKPESSTWWRLGRLLLAIAAGYALLLVTVAWRQQEDYKILQEFWHQFPNCVDHRCANQPKMVVGGKAFAFLIVMGWIPAISYAGFYELIWRERYHRAIIAQGGAFKGKWVSNAAIGFFGLCLFIGLFFGLYLLVVLAMFLE